MSDNTVKVLIAIIALVGTIPAFVIALLNHRRTVALEEKAIDAAEVAAAQGKKLDKNTEITTDIKKQTDGLTDVLVKTEARASDAEGQLKGAKDEHAKQHNSAPTRPHTTRSRKSDKARKRKATP